MRNHATGGSHHATRLLIAALAVVVGAAGCGSDGGSDLADPAQNEGGVVGSGPDSRDADQTAAGSDAGTPDSFDAAGVGGADGAVSAAGALSRPTTAVDVGDRFEWCAPVREAWDDYTQASRAVAEAAEALSVALAAHTAATDSLDRAEAAAAVESAQAVYDDARSTAEWTASWTLGPLVEGAAFTSSGPTDDTADIAFARAWEAFVAVASPEEVALAQIPHWTWVRDDLPEIAESEAQSRFSEPDWNWAFLGRGFVPRTIIPRTIEDAIHDSQDAIRDSQPEPATELDPEELDARFGLTDLIYWVRRISPEEVQALGEDRILEAATAASNAAERFAAMTVTFSGEALSALARLQDALTAVRDARDAGSTSQAAAIAVEAFAATHELEVSKWASYMAASMTFGAEEATRYLVEHADIAGFSRVGSGFVDEAASLSNLEAVVDLDGRNLALGDFAPVMNGAYGGVLLHSTAHAAFVRSLSESCS